MQITWNAALLCGAAVLTFGAAASAQPGPPPAGMAPPPTMGQAPLYDPQQLPAYRGQVQQFTLTRRGDIDGLILSDGTEVKTPPHLSTELAYAVKPGDTVTVHGLRAAALPLLQPISITNEANGQTVVDHGPPGPRRGLGAPRRHGSDSCPHARTPPAGTVTLAVHWRGSGIPRRARPGR